MKIVVASYGVALGLVAYVIAAQAAERPRVIVNVSNFVRAETDLYLSKKKNALGTLEHERSLVEVDKQTVVRSNRDTLYSAGVFDLDAAPVVITLPDAGDRFMSMQVISEDHYTIEVTYRTGRYEYNRDNVGTRYAFVAIRTFVDPDDPGDMQAAHQLQDTVQVSQARTGKFETPNWDPASRANVRAALSALAATGRGQGEMFGRRGEVDPVQHLIGAAVGWGGFPRADAVYEGEFPSANDGQTVHKLHVQDVPVDGLWSVTVYNARGSIERNALGAYSLNNVTATPAADGSFTIQFGNCSEETPNCLPTMPGWNYTVRLYRPRRQILDGSWTFPVAEPVR